MKKMVCTLLSLTVLIAATNVTANAQDNDFALSTVNQPPKGKKTNEADAAEIRNIVSSDFSKRHRVASDIVWTTTGKLTSVYFKEDGLSVRCTYNEKGRLEYTLRYFIGAQAPKSVVKLLKADGYHMSITQVVEVKRGNKTSHTVKMEDETTYLTLLVKDGEIHVQEMLNKY